MELPFSCLGTLLLSLFLASPSAAQTSGKGYAERYYDCCKPDCAWEGKADFNHPVRNCDKNSETLSGYSSGSGCNGGDVFACADQSPWAVNDTFSYGFAGVFIMQHASDYWCCGCYELTFTSGDVKGKKMVVQAHNSAYDVTTANRFTLAVPGGNTSYAQACATQYDVSSSVFGIEKQGVSSKDQCSDLPKPLQAGCNWRFNWFMNASHPELEFQRVTCPTELTDITGCIRNDDTTFMSAASTVSMGLAFSSLLTFGCIVVAMLA